MTWLPVLAVALLLVAAIGVRAVGTPTEPGPEFVGRAAALTFDEHAAVATALLQPDVPLFTEPDADQIAFAAEWLDYVDSLPCTQES